MPSPRADKVLLLGLDCVPPSLVFDRWRGDLPVLDRLLSSGARFGPLRSTDPPITVPAWMSMMTGQDPGQLGLYGFRLRRDRSSPDMVLARADRVAARAVWDVLGDHGFTTTALGVPLTYPPRPIHGVMVSGMLTPSRVRVYTQPAGLQAELEAVLGPYPFDVEGYRHLDPRALVAQLGEQTRRRFAWARHLALHHPWDLFVFVETGPDRLHHRFWRYMDPSHPKFVPDHPLGQAALAYYRRLDAQVGELLASVPEDTWVIIASDHGARPLRGGFCVNEFLIREGWLVLKHVPDVPRPLTPEDIDWSRTRAWAEGGYYARVFLNVAGRETFGVVHSRAAERYRRRLEQLFLTHRAPDGVPERTRCLVPERLYREVRGVPPDLMVYFGDLDYRAVGSVGHGRLRVPTNDTGPDDANHDPYGLFVVKPGAGDPRGQGIGPGPTGVRSILDVAPTVLRLFGVPVPGAMSGEAIT